MATKPEAATDTQSIRERILLDATDLFLQVHADWSATEQKLITEQYEESVNDLLFTFASGDLPARCRQLAQAVALLGDEWTDFEGYVTQFNPQPRDSFWAAVRAVQSARAGSVKPVRKRIEPVAMLVKQNVPLNQIALHIYGHLPPGSTKRVGPFLENGIPRHDLIYQEAEKPGSVLGENWVHPEEIARLKAEEDVHNRRLERLAERAKSSRPAPESVEELLRQKVYPQQIARMKHISVEDVYREAERLRMPATEMPNLSTMRAPHEPEINQAAAAELDAAVASPRLNVRAPESEVIAVESGDIDDLLASADKEVTDQEILNYASAGNANVADIAADLGVDPGRVKKLLRTKK